MVAAALNAPGELPMSETLSVRFAAFVQHAWNKDRKRFRNFMSFDRRWLEDIGSEDSHRPDPQPDHHAAGPGRVPEGRRRDSLYIESA